jgi:hypothetical protein
MAIQADHMEGVLAEIDPDDHDLWNDLPGYGVLLRPGCPVVDYSPAGQEHGRTIPLAVMKHDRLLNKAPIRSGLLLGPKCSHATWMKNALSAVLLRYWPPT